MDSGLEIRDFLAQDSESLQEVDATLRENFKLSSYESRTYLTLLRRGKQTPKELSSTASVPMPRIYDTLESLMSKGFAVKQEEYYSPIPAKQALKGRSAQFELQFTQEQRRRKMAEEQLLSELEDSANKISRPDTGEISILKGFNSISNKFIELLEESADVLLVAKRAIEAREVFIPILLQHSMRKGVKRRIRILAPRGVKITQRELEEARHANAVIRRTDHIIFDLMITDKDDVIIGVPDPLSNEINHAIAIWVRNRAFASSTRRTVEEIWKVSDKT